MLLIGAMCSARRGSVNSIDTPGVKWVTWLVCERLLVDAALLHPDMATQNNEHLNYL